jgi:hypothetical protein
VHFGIVYILLAIVVCLFVEKMRLSYLWISDSQLSTDVHEDAKLVKKGISLLRALKCEPEVIK